MIDYSAAKIKEQSGFFLVWPQSLRQELITIAPNWMPPCSNFNVWLRKKKKTEGRAKWQKKQNISLNEERSWQKKKNVWLVSVYQQVTFKCPRIHANDTSSQPANFPAAISGQLPSPRPASRKTSLNMNPYDHLEPDEIMAYYYYASAYSWTLAGVAYKKKVLIVHANFNLLERKCSCWFKSLLKVAVNDRLH